MKNYSIGFVIGASLGKGFAKALGGARTQFSTLGAEIKRLSGQRGLIERFEKDQAALEKARLSLAAATAEVNRLKLAMRKAPSEETARALEKAREKADRLSAAVEKQRGVLRLSEQALSRAGMSVKNLGGQYGRLGQALDETRRKHDRLEAALARKSAAGQRLSELRGSLLGLMGAVYATGRLVGGALGFEDAGVRLSTVVNAGSDPGAALAASKRHALGYTRRNLSTETEITDIEYALNSAGMDAATARSGSEMVAKVAKVTRGQAEAVGEVLATVYNNLGDRLEGDAAARFTRIGDLLTKTQFKFQIRDFAQLGESMKYAAPDLAKFNVELSQGVTLIGALNSAGLQGSMAGTALSASFRNMGKAAGKLGFDIARDEKGGVDFIRTLENISAAIGGFENMSQKTADALAEAFGAEGERAIVLLGLKLAGLRDAQKDVAEGSRGLVDESYKRFLESTSGQLQVFTNNVRVLGMTFAGTLLPAINSVLQPLTAVAGWAVEALERYPRIGQAVGAIAAVLGVFVTALTVVTAATWAWNAAMIANPIGLTIAAIAGAAALVITFWDPISAYFKKLWEGIKTVFRKGVEYLTVVWEMSPLGMLFKAGQKLAGYVGGLFGGGKASGIGTAVTPPAGGGSGPRLSIPPPADISNQTNMTVAPTIHVAAGADYGQVKAAVAAGMGESEKRFGSMLDAYLSDQRRLAYE